MEFLNKISIICFTASYWLVWSLELIRLFTNTELFRARMVQMVQRIFLVAGLFAHSVYLVQHGGLAISSSGLAIGNWYGWCLLGSWILALCYLWLSLRQAQTHLGLFLLPCILALIGFGYRFGSFTLFSDRHARSTWNWIHGFSLLLGTVVVGLGFVFGLVYLAQANRLKRKSVTPRWLRLPSLEWLQVSAERCLFTSAVLLSGGLISGIAIARFPVNAEINSGSSTSQADSWMGVNWSDPVVWSSSILFGWLVLVTVFSLFYQPARQGRKVAYLIVVSFLFLMLELLIAWSVGHATVAMARLQQSGRAEANAGLAVTGDFERCSAVGIARLRGAELRKRRPASRLSRFDQEPVA